MTFVRFNTPTQNSILICQINLDPSDIPDYYTVHIECYIKTPLDTIQVLTSIPLIHESPSVESYYKCLIPYNSLPSIKYKSYEIKYKLILNIFSKISKSTHEYPFEVYPSGIFTDYKYDIFINSDMVRIDGDLDDSITSFSEIVKFIRSVDDECDIKKGNESSSETIKCDKISDIKKINDKITSLNMYREVFATLLDRYKNKGDIYFYIKKAKKIINKLIECEIKQEGFPVILLKYTKIFENKMEIEIEYFKNVSNTKIYLVCKCNGEEEETDLVNIDSSYAVYKKIEIAKKWDIFNIKTEYFSIEIFLRIFVDEFSFVIKPLFLHRKGINSKQDSVFDDIKLGC
jgi:hypothetical protein